MRRNWEFLPAKIFYIPLVLYVALKCIQYLRPPHWLVKVNPGLPYGGLFDSKDEILSMFTTKEIATFEYVNPKEKTKWNSFPCILKPDQSQRGAGVQRLHTKKELNHAIQHITQPHIIQEYVDYPHEFGVFYLHVPHQQPQLFSITNKILHSVKGDGKHTLEHLIDQLDTHPKRKEQLKNLNKTKLNSIPKKNKHIQLTFIGNHCRGSEFQEASQLITPKLTKRITKIMQSVPDFYLSRLDIKSENAQLTGKIKIVEINALLSESVNIYDQGYSIWDAYKILFKQWDLTFRIASKNEHKMKTPRVLDMLREAKKFLKA